MNNTIELIKKDLQRHKVEVVLPNEKDKKSLYLIMIIARTSKLEDFKKTYGDKATPVHLKIAAKIFGENETNNTYGLLLNEDLKIAFAFNREFADYDAKRKEIIYKDIDDVLLERIKTENKEKKKISPKDILEKFPLSPKDFDHNKATIKYSLIEKEK